MNIIFRSLFDGFGPGGMFMRLKWPDAPTRLFAESPGVWGQQEEVVQEILSADRAGRIVSATRSARSGSVESVVVFRKDDLGVSGTIRRA